MLLTRHMQLLIGKTGMNFTPFLIAKKSAARLHIEMNRRKRHVRKGANGGSRNGHERKLAHYAFRTQKSGCSCYY